MTRTDVPRANRWLSRGVLFLAASAVYLYAWPTPTLFYEAIVLLHVLAGLVVAALLAWRLWPLLRAGTQLDRVGWFFLTAGTILGLVLIRIGTPHRLKYWLYAHIALCAVGLIFLATGWLNRKGWVATALPQRAVAFGLLLAAAAAVAYGSWWARTVAWDRTYRISNPSSAPETMDDEGDGPKGDFFPSSAQTRHHGKIPASYFMESDACQRCHADIYKQWDSSMHHFSSFNNQWYRKSIEYMQDVAGVRSSKWCAGCHDPALLYSGMFDTPIKEIVNRPAARAGLGCMMCHSIAQVKSTMGQGDFYLEYPKLHQLAASKNPIMRSLHDFMVRLNPEPHRRTFLKPFMRTETAEFCSSCHKVHLDVPVNRYRWVRGFNEYDNWQGSGISGQGARSFYYPKSPMNCADCHMPQVRSNDDGNINGFVHSHRFPGANTAVPTANEDQSQLEFAQHFLKDGQLSVDIFAVSPAGKELAGARNQPAGPEIATTFAVGEEADISGPKGPAGEERPITAPIDLTNAAVRRGDDALVDVVVRTRKVGHFFPGGTVDAFDVWLELQATDDKGQTIFWSGKVEDNGKGPVEPGAHFYRSLQIDAHGNPINKRNAWSTRATVYAHLIPPGAADTVHFRMHIPENAGEKITLHAKLNYRKFSWFNTHFAFAGVEQPAVMEAADVPATTPSYDDRKWAFNGDTSQVSGNLKSVPDLPITVLAEDTKTLRVLPRNAPIPRPQTISTKEIWTRWNDYGIGLFLQGDLKAAAAAFQKIVDADPQNPDGWTNVGRVLLQEGDTAGARKVLEQSLALMPQLARTNYFYARVLKDEGDYDGASAHLQIVLAQYPRDRVVLNELGRILFLQKRYADAVKEFQQTLAIDPEDLQAHYNLMLCYNGLGDDAKANEHKLRYLRFKADEASQAITGPYRQIHPEDNNERQPIHEHVSVPLNTPSAPQSASQRSAQNRATHRSTLRSSSLGADVSPARAAASETNSGGKD
ncbi:MAG TPA: tetratricopeptide repeat protein [Candidatus Acidoferrales bacterium]|nr:tetratricopeptide repeat protein [Candidatus Acidoferrales bacterium]